MQRIQLSFEYNNKDSGSPVYRQRENIFSLKQVSPPQLGSKFALLDLSLIQTFWSSKKRLFHCFGRPLTKCFYRHCSTSHLSGANVRVTFQYLHTAERLTWTAQGEAGPAKRWGNESCKLCRYCQLSWLNKEQICPQIKVVKTFAVSISEGFFLNRRINPEPDSLTSHRLPVSTWSEPTEMSFQAA